MSSPFPGGNHGCPRRSTASSPAPTSQMPPIPSPTNDVTIIRMRLKVLYTFDDENKTNCLARWPQPLDIRTAQLDENTQVGVIELKTCIQAIVSASPELVAKLGQDYTVYAYDYSEYETPLVGQGMLSWVLASSSATPSAPAHQSRTMVTGRVCKNLLLFGNNSQDTLEVKLRLVPVPTSLQSEYIESMNKYKEISNMVPPGFDMASWTSFIQANPGLMKLAQQPQENIPTGHGIVQREGVGIEHVQRLMNEGNASDAPGLTAHETQNNQQPVFQPVEPIPRPPSAASSVQSTRGSKRRGRPPKRPISRSANKIEPLRTAKQPPQRASAESGYASNDERTEPEDGPSRKRAKVSQADWPGKTDFAKQPDSLLVAASTAASVRMLQPQPMRPSPHSIRSLEPPPRAPTPVAKAAPPIRRPALPTARSSLRRESIIESDDNYQSPYATSEAFPRPPESEATSPDDSAKESAVTPIEMGSSPPVLPRVFEASSSPDFSPQTTFLPDLDSGFASGTLDDLFNDDELRPLDADDLDMLDQYSKRPDLGAQSFEIDTEPQLPRFPRFNTEINRQEPPTSTSTDAAISKASENQNAGPPGESHGLKRTASANNVKQQNTEKVKKQAPALRRTQTWSESQAAPPSSEASFIGDTGPLGKVSTYRARSGNGSGAKRRRAVQNKLEKAVAAGEMPPFCEHCGAIETPTWRKAWVKLYSGTPDNVHLSTEDGGIVTWQPLQTDVNGAITLYRVVKKTLLPNDEGFSEILLCNPCGLWLHNRKCMRPPENWERPRDPEEEERPGSRMHQRKGSSNGARPGNEASQPAGRSSGAASPVQQGHNEQGYQPKSNTVSLGKVAHKAADHPGLQAGRLDEATAAAALKKAIQSSPARLVGSQRSPIEVQEDLTPKPTRRLLFPSPSGSQTSALLHESDENFTPNKGVSPSKPIQQVRRASEDHVNKENEPPRQPTSPTLFKTPSKTPSRALPCGADFLSSTAKAILRPQTTPKQSSIAEGTQVLAELTPFSAQLNQMLSEAPHSSPSSSGFDFPSLPSLRNTPRRNGVQFDFSNFDSQNFLSTDLGMPSSPPAPWGIYEDHNDQENWHFPATPTSGRKVSPPQTQAKTPSLRVDGSGRASVDASG